MTKKNLIIDAHAHFLPPEAVAKVKAYGTNNFSATPLTSVLYQNAQDIEKTLSIMEDAGIDMSVLNQAAWSVKGLAICREINNSYSQIKRKYPNKFIFCVHVPLEGTTFVLDEILRSINELGLNGISLISSMPDVTLDSPELRPLYEMISRLNVPIVVHPTIRFPLWGGSKKYKMCETVSREYDLAKAVIEVMYGVLKDFPDLKFVFSHYGGGMPGLKARIRSHHEPENSEIPEETKDRAKTPRELAALGIGKVFDELFDKLYFDMAGSGAGWLPMVNAALATIRVDRLCFGTDYPYEVQHAEDLRWFIDTIKNLNITQNEKVLLLGGNIKNLFNV